MIELSLSSSGRDDFIDVTSLVQKAATDLQVKSGILVVFNPHTTAGITINEGADPDVVADLTRALDRIVPWEGGYRHAEGNAAAHVKATLCGSSVHVLVESGRLKLGTWQKIWFCEFDGPRHRRLWAGVAGQ